MKVLRTLLLMLTGSLLLSGCSQASDLDASLKRAQKEGKMVMLELGSAGCIPCERMKPVMAGLSENYGGKLDVIFVDVKKDQSTARRFGVYMIPVQVFLDKNGHEFHRHLGYYDYDEIVPILKKQGL